MIETFQEYTDRLLSLSAGADPFAVLGSTAATIAARIAGRSSEELRRAPSPSQWSVAQIVAHLADSEIVFAYRLRMTLAATGTPLQAYDQDAWSRAQHAETSDPHLSLALFTAIRESTVRLLRSLNAEELERYGMHAERGKETVRHLLALYAGHDRNHLAQIERLLT